MELPLAALNKVVDIDHAIVVNERHLRRLMKEYVRHYHEDRTSLALAKETPAGREAERRSDVNSRIIAMPRLGGLHHRYDLAAYSKTRDAVTRSRCT